MSVNTKVNGQLVPSAGLYKKSTPICVATCYSEDEHKIGVWINGKPLYQKTLEYNKTNIQGNINFDITSDMANVDEVVAYESRIDYVVQGQSADSSYYSDDLVRLSKTGSSYAIFLTIGQATFSTADIYMTIQYTKTTDNVTVNTYAPIVPMNIASKYRLEEKVVGQWLDGKPLYQKTIDFGTLPNATTKSVAHGISNITGDNVVSINPIASAGSYAIFARIHDQQATNQCFFEVTDTNVICYARGANLSSYTQCYVTIQYTKTTDTANTGLYSDDEATLGMLGDVDLENLADGDIIRYNGTSGKFENVAKEVYSTDEQVIGKWIDGKPLYQKSWELSSEVSCASQSFTSLGIDASGMETIVGQALQNSMGTLWDCVAINTNADTNHIGVLNTRNAVIMVKYVTLKYTKSS